MLRKRVADTIKQTLDNLGLPTEKLVITPPKNESFGDYATPVALALAKEQKINPLELAERIVQAIPENDVIEKLEVVKPGFINIWLKKSILIETLKKTINDQIEVQEHTLGSHKKTVIEYAHPNTHKLFHIGHLRNIITGEAVARILEATGNKIIRINYQGDVGLHIAKTIWQIKNELHTTPLKELEQMPIREKIAFMGKAYAQGNTAYEKDEDAKRNIISINKQIFEQDRDIIPLWKTTRQWSLDYFDEIYNRVDTHFDRLFFESEMAERAIEIVKKAVADGILEESDGAIVLNGEKHGVHTRVFVNSIGLPTYEGKELALAEKEFSEFGKIDKVVHVVTAEQSSFFATTFKAEELIKPDEYKGKQYHLVYGWVDVKGNKMSSRKGNVIEGEWLLDETKKSIKEAYASTPETAETLANAAVKYSFLKNGLQSDVEFDLSHAISIQGDSGPYLLYTYVRCKSVLTKHGASVEAQLNNLDTPFNAALTDEEVRMLRLLVKFPDIVYDAAEHFAPNTICAYLFEIAQLYNLFYQKHQILKIEDQYIKKVRLAITAATARVLYRGLNLLGIQTVERM